METIIDKVYLAEHPNEIFVFGDNLARKGYGGAAVLRDLFNTYGFITTKYPTYEDEDYYKPDEYEKVFYSEITKLVQIIKLNPDKTFLISKLGAGLANKYKIFETIIAPKIRKLLAEYKNVRFLYEKEVEHLTQEYWAYIDTRGKLNVFELRNPLDPEAAKLNKNVVDKVLSVKTAKSKDDAKVLYEQELQATTGEIEC